MAGLSEEEASAGLGGAQLTTSSSPLLSPLSPFASLTLARASALACARSVAFCDGALFTGGDLEAGCAWEGAGQSECGCSSGGGLLARLALASASALACANPPCSKREIPSPRRRKGLGGMGRGGGEGGRWREREREPWAGGGEGARVTVGTFHLRRVIKILVPLSQLIIGM